MSNIIKIIRKPKTFNIETIEYLDIGDIFELKNGDGSIFLKLTDDGFEYIDCFDFNSMKIRKLKRELQCFKIYNIKIEYEVNIF